MDDRSAAIPQLVQGALRDQPAGAHDARVGADLLDLGEQVARDEHGRAVGGQRAHERAHLPGALRVQAVGRLVEHQEVAGPQKGVRQAEPLLHPQRVGLHLLVRCCGQADPVEGLRDPAPAAAPVRAGVGGVEALQVRGARQVRGEARALHEGADGGEDLGQGVRHRPPEQLHAAGRRVDEAEQHPDRRRLARSVRAEEAEDAAGGHRQVHGVDGGSRAEPLGERGRLDGERRSGGHVPVGGGQCCAATACNRSRGTAPASTRPSSVRRTFTSDVVSARPPATSCVRRR